jgi:hypothetical protein
LRSSTRDQEKEQQGGDKAAFYTAGHMEFFYALRSVKSNHMSTRLAQTIRLFAVALLLFSGVVWAQSTSSLVIVEEPLPVFDAGVEIKITLHARGGFAPYHWRIADGLLPDGIIFTPEGVLTGRPAQPGVFNFTVAVEDSARPANTINKQIQTKVTASLLLEWLHQPLVRGGSIDGSVKVSNGAKDDFDLTVIVVAVNENGRATALGYQHFTLRSGTMYVPITFGSNLPRGTYTVHADAVAEIPAKNTILRKQLETPAPLPITQGP